MEKILIRAVDNPCGKCKIKTLCKRKCMFFQMWKNGSVSRKKAINIMAKAIFEDMLKGHNLTWEDADISAKKPFINQAETALNALIKGAKQ